MKINYKEAGVGPFFKKYGTIVVDIFGHLRVPNIGH